VTGRRDALDGRTHVAVDVNSQTIIDEILGFTLLLLLRREFKLWCLLSICGQFRSHNGTRVSNLEHKGEKE
jgi:hypothetical protein